MTATDSPNSWLGTVNFTPSAGFLLKCSGNPLYLAMIRGGSLDRPINGSGIDLIRAGLRSHRAPWVRT